LCALCPVYGTQCQTAHLDIGFYMVLRLKRPVPVGHSFCFGGPMELHGLQKLTLLDYPGKTGCTLFFGGCNLRCPFCHNASLVLRPGSCPTIPENELFAFLKKRQGLLDGVCVTGGEPLLQPGLADLLKRIRELGYAVKLDTNGCFPDRLEKLIEAGLVDYVAMDLKNSREEYPKTVGIANFDTAPIDQSIRLLMEGRVEYEFRTTVVQGLHTVHSLGAAAFWIDGAQNYFLQNFVDSGDLIEPGLTAFSPAEMRHFLNVVKPHVKNAGLRGI